jgi:hypothetical protein
MLMEIRESSTIACSFWRLTVIRNSIPVERKLHITKTKSITQGQSICPAKGKVGSSTWGERLGYLFTESCARSKAVVVSILIATCWAVPSQAQSSPSAAAASAATTSPLPKDAPASNQRVILKVGDVQVTQAQFEAVIGALEAQQGPADLSRKALGDNYASLLMFSQQAVAQHLDTSPEVVRQLAIDRTQILSNAAFAALKREAKPTPEQISAYYNAHLEDYDTVQLLRLFIWKSGPGSSHDKGLTPQQANALASAVRQATANGTDPHKLITDRENEVMDAEPLSFQRGELPKKMDDAAFALHKVGEWSVLEDSPDALILLQLVSRGRRDLKDVSPQIEKILQGQKLREDLEALKKKSGIWMDEAYFASDAPIPIPSTEPDASGQDKAK